MLCCMVSKYRDVICIGAGPAGLTAAYLLTRDTQKSVLVLESDKKYVGGISKTVKHKGYCFDVGGHRFFSKSKEVESLWSEILPEGFLTNTRKSQIFYNNIFFSYPLKPFEALFRLGVIGSFLCLFSYFKAILFPIKNPKNFEEWMINSFGYKLYLIFFKTYTEKVWGMKCSEISSDWASQRIQGLTLSTSIFNSFFPSQNKVQGQVIKTLIDTFRYPKKGPGMLWEECKKKIIKNGGSVQLGNQVVGVEYCEKDMLWKVSVVDQENQKIEYKCKSLVSSAPLSDFVGKYLSADKDIKKTAQKLNYRDFISVSLILKEKNKIKDHWIYIHNPLVRVGRIQNYKAWSKEMVPDAQMNCYGLEYFCFEGDGLWDLTDASLIELAKKELCKLNLAHQEEIQEGFVIRQKKAYPVYDQNYAKNVEVIRKYTEEKFTNLHFVGRNGMHKYNNQDHSMMTAMLTVKNIILGYKKYNTWNVNQDAELIEKVENEISNKNTLMSRDCPKSIKILDEATR